MAATERLVALERMRLGGLVRVMGIEGRLVGQELLEDHENWWRCSCQSRAEVLCDRKAGIWVVFIPVFQA